METCCQPVSKGDGRLHVPTSLSLSLRQTQNQKRRKPKPRRRWNQEKTKEPWVNRSYVTDRPVFVIGSSTENNTTTKWTIFNLTIESRALRTCNSVQPIPRKARRKCWERATVKMMHIGLDTHLFLAKRGVCDGTPCGLGSTSYWRAEVFPSSWCKNSWGKVLFLFLADLILGRMAYF